MSITVHGQVLPNADRFSVNLRYGSDYTLHFNPRYRKESGYVVLNTCQNNTWGYEVNVPQTPFPRGQLFALQILVTLSSYKISTNGEPFFEFEHRMNFSDVDRINIAGMAKVSLVAFQYHAPKFGTPSGSLKVPYKSIIDGGLRPGQVIIIEGVINHEGMEIFLRHKTGIAFYYNPRFEKNVVVCNSYEEGKWGKEEIHELMPIETGKPLQVTIFCSHHGYVVFVNGQQTHTYSHRFTNLEEIDVLDIRGDVQLSSVEP